MDQDTKRNIMLGLFVVLGIIIFIFGIFLVGAKSGLFTKSFMVYAMFKNTSGLKPVPISGSMVKSWYREKCYHY